MSLTDGFRLALGTLTALPVPPPRVIDKRTCSIAMLASGVAAIPLGLGVLAAWWLLDVVGAPLLLAAVLLTGVPVFLTRGMHLDGLADTCDGLSVPFDRERALRAMKASDIGPSGVGAIVIAIAVQIAAWTTLATTWSGALLATGCLVFSRQLLVLGTARWMPPARPEGLGATMAQSVAPVSAVLSIAALAAVGTMATLIGPFEIWVWPGVVAGACLAAGLLLLRCRARFGGMTGDVLGATIEVGFSTALAVAAILV